ncbi:MAG TPA: ATP-dependent zinc metalloprotease FtsH [Candidatus Dojkabacteria bacterium]|nr:ATP-dependent zinc metalloprotease FtsH [Candidatus Dojkabacteria bacterium]
MAQKEKKEKKADVRKVKPVVKRFSINITSVVITITISILVLIGWTIFLNIQSKGSESTLPQIVSDISKNDYTKVIVRDDAVIIEKNKTQSINGKDTAVPYRQYALLPPNTVFSTVLYESGINYKDVKNISYEPAVAISISDIIWIVLLAIGLFLMYNLVKGMQTSGGRLMDFGTSKARVLFGRKTGTTFDDVAGIGEVKEELVEIVDFLKNPKKYAEIGARVPRGVLLAGAPGTGKTLLAKAVAGEAGVPFFHTSGSEFEEMLVGAGASRVRDLFLKAKKANPSIIFIDEIDAVAKKRGTVLHSGAGEQTLNQILVEMDGLEERENVIVLAATNRPDVLDPAILRPGRFDRTVTVRMPNLNDRKAILEVHAKNKKFENDVDLELIAKKTTGYSGADLENLLNEAAIMAVKENRKKVSRKDLLESYLKVKLGRKRKNEKDDETLKRVAYHEAGHAVVSKLTPASTPVEMVSILSRGNSGGVTVYTPEKERSLITKEELLASIVGSVGAKVAEEIFLGGMSTAAAADIEMATDTAKEMVRVYGMSDKLGFVKYGDMEETSNLGYSYGGGRDYSDKTAELIDNEIKDIIDDAQAKARKILNANKKIVEELVELLLEKEEVTKDEFNKLFE